MTAGAAVPWPVPPSEATTGMFAALSPERLESESLTPESLKHGSLGSGSLTPPSERLVTSGGAGDRDLPGQDRDDRARQPRRMRRLALVSGLSVLLAVGVTTGGARLIAGRTSLTMEQPTTACPTSENCAAADGPHGASGSGQALGETPAPGDPTGDPVQDGQEDSGTTGADQGGTDQNDTGKNKAAQGGSAAPQATPVSTAASKGRDRDHASARTRTPSTAAPRASAHASPRVGDAPAAVTAAPDDTTGTASDDGATPGETALDDTDDTGSTGDAGDTAGADEAGTRPDRTTGTNHTTGTNTARTRSALAGGGPAVGVRFTVTDRDRSGYTARIAVRNEGPAMPAWTIRLAVGGQVTAVEGADWRQQGDTLTLSSQARLDEGGTLTLTVHADGASAAPADCVLSEGRCEVTGPGPSRRGD
ncbi:hypothetical protein [Microbispora sp. KK1-11]|uniref:hypothetical protein n=1 Tax=Microbispora sp. KK1-11 TaxID=2053005 RepID=UPI0011593457|nr:hypothetical protein [Microbispora sp. KK1-11]TQS26912.1 hypothetical protein FLW16_23280 [Microbispora sp. KK1-11]